MEIRTPPSIIAPSALYAKVGKRPRNTLEHSVHLLFIYIKPRKLWFMQEEDLLFVPSVM